MDKYIERLIDEKIIEKAIDEEDTSDSYYFEMKDNYETFEVGINTILTCLHIAEKTEVVPQLPEEWWVKMLMSCKDKIVEESMKSAYNGLPFAKMDKKHDENV